MRENPMESPILTPDIKSDDQNPVDLEWEALSVADGSIQEQVRRQQEEAEKMEAAQLDWKRRELEAKNLLTTRDLRKIRRAIKDIEEERATEQLLQNIDQHLENVPIVDAETGEPISEDDESKAKKAPPNKVIIKRRPSSLDSSSLGLEPGGFTISSGREPGAYHVQKKEPGALRKFLSTLWTEASGALKDVWNSFR